MTLLKKIKIEKITSETTKRALPYRNANKTTVLFRLRRSNCFYCWKMLLALHQSSAPFFTHGTL